MAKDTKKSIKQEKERPKTERGFLDPEEIADLSQTIAPPAPKVSKTKEPEIEAMEDEEAFDDGYLSGYLDAQDEEELEPITQEIENTSILEKRENTRGRLATIYTIFTFLVFIFAMIISVIDGLVRQESIITNLTEIIPVISGVFLGTLGFVLGYYFRKEEE